MKKREKRTRLEPGSTMEHPERYMRGFYKLLAKMVEDTKAMKHDM
jgi:hypothetical protein